MTERNQLGGPLRRHHSGDLRDGQHIALLDGVFPDRFERLPGHRDDPSGAGEALGDLLGGHVDHSGLSGSVDVTQVAHGRSSANSRSREEPMSCGLTLPLARSFASSTARTASAARRAPSSSPAAARSRTRPWRTLVRASSTSLKNPRALALPNARPRRKRSASPARRTLSISLARAWASAIARALRSAPGAP